MIALKFTWNPLTGIDLGFITIHFYSLMFVVAFSLGYYLTKKVYNNEKVPLEKLDSLFMYAVVSILLGARLGHVLFYQTELLDGRKVILNGGVTKHSYTQAPSIAYYPDEPKKVRNLKSLVKLGQVGLGYLNFVPKFIKTSVDGFADSWYKQQAMMESLLLVYFEAHGNKEDYKNLKAQTFNPFFFY